MNPTKPAVLQRELGLWGAVMMGLGAIVGTGVFVSIGVAAGITGPSVLLAIAVAGFVAMCNALSSAQLAASHPVSGGSYEYGYRYLHPTLGFTAGWMFLFAKSASAATAALGFSGYLVYTLGIDDRFRVPLAVATSISMTMIVLAGIRRTNVINVVIVSITLLSLLAFVVFGLPTAWNHGAETYRPFWKPGENGTVVSFLYATALMFVAYTGYGRIATLGEEVRNPRRTIPQAIVMTLALSFLLYIAVASVAVGVVGTTELSESVASVSAPLQVVARKFPVPAIAGWVALGAITAMLGVLLNLILGLSRVLLAMGRRGDMPPATATLNATQTTPTVAVIVVGMVVTSLTCIGSIKTTWSFSACTVLIYYAITNLAALRLSSEESLYPRAFAWSGFLACLFLAFWVPWSVWAVSLVLIGFGIAWQYFSPWRKSN